MNKKDFLNELENALDGRLPQSDIREIISDYGDIFDGGVENGKGEEAVAEEIGSPAKIARTILEDGMDTGRTSEKANRESSTVFSSEAKGEREYTDFQKNINEKTSKIFDKVIDPDQNVNIEQLASMSRRLGAYVIDSILLGAVTMGGLLALMAPFLFFARTSSVIINDMPMDMSNAVMEDSMFNMGGIASGFAIGNIVIFVLIFGAFNLFTTIILWATNGYTPGKWILKMRVVKINGQKISFLDAVLRELVIKCIANSILSGILNIISFIWGCVTDDHKTAHDLVVQTRVVEWDRLQNKASDSFSS